MNKAVFEIMVRYVRQKHLHSVNWLVHLHASRAFESFRETQPMPRCA
jgi:hypothetical protein